MDKSDKKNGPNLKNKNKQLLYSGSPSSGSDVVRLFAKRSAKSRAPRKIAHSGSRERKNKSCVHPLTSCVCVLTTLPEDGEPEYRNFVHQF